MKAPLLLILIILLLNSCATLQFSPTFIIKVISDRTTKLEFEGKTYNFEKGCKISVNSDKDSLIFIAQSDSLRKVIKLFPKNSKGIKNADSIIRPISPEGFNKLRRHNYYQRFVFIDYNSTTNPPKRFLPAQKGQFNLIFSIPYINSFNIQPLNEPVKVKTGFWGVTAGTEYYYKRNKFVNFTVGVATDFFVPVPAAVDIRGEFESLGSTYISLSNNYRIKNFTVGYGLNYSNNVWDLSNPYPVIPQTRVYIKKSSQSIGLTLNSYLQLSKHFYLGLIYRPTFLKTSPVHKMEYEHIISLDCAWKWKIKK